MMKTIYETFAILYINGERTDVRIDLRDDGTAFMWSDAATSLPALEDLANLRATVSLVVPAPDIRSNDHDRLAHILSVMASDGEWECEV